MTTVHLTLTDSEIDQLLLALNTHQTALCDAWRKARERGSSRTIADSLERRIDRVDVLAATLRAALPETV